MSFKNYTADSDNLQVSIHYYPTDGVQVTVSIWNGNDFVTKFDKRVIADSLWEAVGDALTQGLDVEWDKVEGYLTEWEITPPEDED